MKTTKKSQAVVVLDGVRSVHNVGSIFRTSDALGISKLYLCGITPTPVDRFGRERADLNKAALGAQKTVAWGYTSSALETVTRLKADGFTVVTVEQDERSVDYRTVIPTGKTAFVFGNEVEGVSKDVLDQSDFVAHIDMAGSKESLNVSVSFGIALFRMLDR